MIIEMKREGAVSGRVSSLPPISSHQLTNLSELHSLVSFTSDMACHLLGSLVIGNQLHGATFGKAMWHHHGPKSTSDLLL